MTRLIAPSFVGFQRSWLRWDLIAGLTVWAVLVPESLAYATIAGVPPVVGLYAAVPALVLYAVLGSSRHLIVSPMSATAALSAGIIVGLAPRGDPQAYVALTTGLALATGMVAILAGVLRLGFLASFISEPVLKGFIIGLALTIMIGQVPDLLGIEKGSGNFFEKAWTVIKNLVSADPLTLSVGLGSLAVMILLRRIAPILPASLMVALAGIGAAALFHLSQHGVKIVGHIDRGLPRLGFPDIKVSDLPDLLGASVGVMLVGFAEGLGAAKTYATKAGYTVDANRELLGLGLANLGSGLASGMVVNGSLSKTAVNGSAGARSQISAVTAAVLTVITLLFLTGLFEKLPEATLAAIVITAVWELIDVASLRRLWRIRTGQIAKVYQLTARVDFVAALAALIGVLLFETLPGLIIGIAVSLLLLIARTSRPHIARLAPVGEGTQRPWVDCERSPEYQPPAGVLVVRIEAPLMFANADYVHGRIMQLADATQNLRKVVVDGRSTSSVDVTAAAMIVQLRNDLQHCGAELVLADNIGQVRDVLARADPHGEPPIFPTLEAALADRPADSSNGPAKSSVPPH